MGESFEVSKNVMKYDQNGSVCNEWHQGFAIIIMKSLEVLICNRIK